MLTLLNYVLFHSFLLASDGVLVGLGKLEIMCVSVCVCVLFPNCGKSECNFPLPDEPAAWGLVFSKTWMTI